MSADDSRFVRWQKIHIEHFGYSTNLILVLGIATVSYSLSFAGGGAFVAAKSHRHCLGILLLIAMVALTLSLFCGLLCTLNRLGDFRGTAKRARQSPDAPTKEELDQVGRRTRVLFNSQVWLFIVGLLFLSIVIWYVVVPGLVSS